MRDITILMDTTQGRPARLLADLTEAGVRIEAGCLFPRLEGRVAHLTVGDDQVETARTVAAALGATLADDRECVVVPADYPGGLNEIAARVADVGVTVQVAYFGSRGQIILATTELDKARQALAL